MLFSLYSLIATLFVLFKSGNGDYINRTPWYKKEHITFSDMLKPARLDILSEPVRGDIFLRSAFSVSPVFNLYF